MAVFVPFSAVRPKEEFASKVAALPYDVMSSEEAREMAGDNAYSFLHVDKAEIDLDESVSIYDEKVYQKAAENLKMLSENGICIRDEQKCFYIYRQIMNGRSQTGLAGCASIDDYIENRIKKHELTRADKEEDRVRHVDTCNANTGPIFLTYGDSAAVTEIIEAWKNSHEPIYDFSDAADVRQTVWCIDCPEVNAAICAEFEKISALYIADGHHRCASAVRVGQKRRAENPDFSGNEEFNFFLAVAFPASELEIMDYNRVVKKLPCTAQELKEKISAVFRLEDAPASPFKPEERHTFGMYLDGRWYKLTALEGSFNESDPVESLDVSILQKNLLAPILGIKDPRTDANIDFIGGIRGMAELERRAGETDGAAFSVYPVSVSELMAIADAGLIMPPKSTWFEPKLLSGLFIHELS